MFEPNINKFVALAGIRVGKKRRKVDTPYTHVACIPRVYTTPPAHSVEPRASRDTRDTVRTRRVISPLDVHKRLGGHLFRLGKG